MKVPHQVILVVAFVGCVVCQGLNDIDVDDIKKKLQESVPGIDELDLDTFNNTKLPNTEEVENTLKEKCKKNGADGAVEALQEQVEYVKLCQEKYINFTVLQSELHEAKRTGSMDEVFGKYCKKWPSIYACFDNVTLIARSCLDDKEKKAFNKTLDIFLELQEFMCFKDGDRLAMFVAEGGVECVKEQKEGVQKCLSETLDARIPDTDDLSVATLPTFLFTAKDCADFDTVRECVNTELEKCKDSTPANIVDAFFKFLKKHMPCEKETSEAVKAGANEADGSAVITSSILFVIASVLLLRIY